MLLADAVRGWGKGHTKRIGYQTASIVRKWFGSMANDIPEEASYPNRKSGMKSACGTRFPCPRWNSPIQVHRQFQVKTLGGVTSLPVSLASQPFLFPNLTLSSIQCMKNLTIMNQNKHLFAHITCYFLDSTNVRIICFLQPNWLSLLVLIVLHLSWRTEDNQWKCHVSENDVSYSW